MIIGLLIIGLLLVAVALKGTQHELAQLLQSDLIGANGFIVWIFAIVALGAIGYIPGLETTSNYLLILLMVVVVLRNGGVWSQFQAALTQVSSAGPAPSIKPTENSSSSSSGSSSSSSSGSSSSDSGGDDTLSTIISVAEIAAMFA